LKVAVIVLAAAGGLFALAIVGVFLVFAAHAFGSMVHRSQSDYADTAAKIATFNLPPGYRYSSAVDMIMLDNVVLQPVPRRDFLIALQGLSTPDTSPAGIATTLGSIEAGFDKDHTCVRAPSEDERLMSASGKAIVLQVLHCTQNGKPKIIEFGRIPAKAPLGVLMATGAPGSFDREALDALARSIR
jgi:hypothetical protein